MPSLVSIGPTINKKTYLETTPKISFEYDVIFNSILSNKYLCFTCDFNNKTPKELMKFLLKISEKIEKDGGKLSRFEGSETELDKLLKHLKKIYDKIKNNFEENVKYSPFKFQIGYSDDKFCYYNDIVCRKHTCKNKKPFNENEDCAICKDKIPNFGKIILQCGHQFDTDCIFALFETEDENNVKCPICRESYY